jgi:hypothetical protein
MSVVEIYFDDCFDLLNNKVQIPISGFGSGSKAKPGGYLLQGSKAKYGADGKWVSPYQKNKDGRFTVNDTKEEFEAKG